MKKSSLCDGLCHKILQPFQIAAVFTVPLIAGKRTAGVTGRQRPCAGSVGESLRAQKRARSGGEEAASRRAERMRPVRAADRRCTAVFRGKPLRTAHRHVRTPQDGFSCEHQADRAQSRPATPSIISKPTFGSRGDFRVRRRNAPPFPTRRKIHISATGKPLISSSVFCSRYSCSTGIGLAISPRTTRANSIICA